MLWHQDGAFWRIEPVEVVTLWLALTHSTPENGCLKVVPGSHKMKLLDVVEATEDAVLPNQIPVEVDEQKAVSLVLEPGDVSLHHHNLVHGSAPNRSDIWRRGLTIRYIPTSTKILDPNAASPLPAQGVRRPGRERLPPPPVFNPARHMAFT